MLDNHYKDNNRSSILSSTGSDESVIILHPRKTAYLWVLAVLVGGLLFSLLLYAVLFSSEWSGNRHSGLSSAARTNVNSIALVRDVEFLKGQMNILITGAMESKIKQLEGSLRSGIISATDLTTVRELKEDLKVLKAYSLQNASTTFGLLDGSEKIGASVHAGASLYSDELLHEIGQVKNLFYISIASWGVAIVLFAGTWLRSYYQLRQIQSERMFRHQMLGKPKTGIY
ncbi:MAG: hypothetical protein L0Y38_04430 [Methylococcaceae bacterium]|nr:hypothetical protein [Methylococcaceae bacterium]MCI0668571.1 hypothetical protein [Methylococcaceae bacterium]MCI0733056.1 hypothetical protein [Methylococcaceae bacterium]